MSEQFFILQVSAAEGAEEFYITSNNHTRMEPVEQARKLDRITQQVSCNKYQYLITHCTLLLIKVPNVTVDFVYWHGYII